MLRRIEASNGVVVYRSPLLDAIGVPHAFSTRIGGVSEGPFASLNLGNPNGAPVQDPQVFIEENYRRLKHAIGCDGRRFVFAHQVHGACVVDPARDAQTGAAYGGFEIGKADALTTTDRTVLVSVRTADCVPVLLASEDGKRVAAVHAGWRGVVGRVATEALKRFDKPSRVIVAIGPSIGTKSFEVGVDVLREFDLVFGPETPFVPSDRGPSHAHLDLREALAIQFRHAGVEKIDTTDRCTVRDDREFFSHRRENGITGRMAAIIGTRA